MKSYLKIFFLNIFIFFILIIIFELIFGHFLKKNNFGYLMRSERQKNETYEVIHNNQKYKFNYKRNFYGFRGEEIDPSEIDIVFEGGSTGNQKFTPEELTIVGLLNEKLKKTNLELKIINASTDGKTTRGYVNDFKFWFPKLQNFKPKFIIFYIGINDSNIAQEEKYDLPWRTEKKISDYIKNNSKLVELVKKLKFRYFNNDIRKEYGRTETTKNLYLDYIYLNYIDAKKKYKNIPYDSILKKQFQKRLDNLDYYINNYNFRPIFITQIKFNGLRDYNLYQINELLKIFCKEKNYHIIKLDEIILDLPKGSFYDKMHTTPRGNKIISEKIFSQLIEIIK